MINNTNKKLLFLLHSSDKGGGSEDDALRLIKYFYENNYEIHLLMPEGLMAEEYKKYATYYQYYQKNFFPVSNRPYREYLYFLRSFLKHKSLVSDLLLKHSYDICISNVVVLVWLMYFLGKRKIPVIAIVRETIYPKYLRLKIYNYLSKYVKYFVFVSESNLMEYKNKTGKNNADIYYTSIEENLPKSSSDTLKSYIGESNFDKLASSNTKLFISGSVNRRKNQLEAVKLLKIYKEKGKIPPYLFIAGDVESEIEYVNEIKAYTKTHSLEDYVVFTGNLDKGYYYSLFELTDVLIVVSKSEGLPIVIFEALKLGKIILSYDVGGISDIIKNGYNGFIIPKNIVKMFDSLESIVNDNQKRTLITANGIITFDKYSDINKNMGIFENIITNIVLDKSL